MAARMLARLLCALTAILVAGGVAAAGSALATDSGWSTPITVNPTSSSLVIASDCPAPNDCTVLNANGVSETFSPLTPDLSVAGRATTIAADATLQPSMSCPSSTECAVGAADGVVWTFDPLRGGTAHAYSEGSTGDTAVACPSTSLCIVVAADQSSDQAESFNPQNGDSRAPVSLGIDAAAVTCQSVDSCIALGPGTGGDGSAIVVFDPLGGTPDIPVQIARSVQFTNLACPTADQCTVTDFQGAAATFDPAQPGRPQIIGVSTSAITGLSCPTAAECLTVSGTNVLEGDPELAAPWSITKVDPQTLTSISCATATTCLAGDYGGRVAIRPAPPSAPPSKHSSTPKAAVGKVTVNQIIATHTGVDITVTCGGPSNARCTLVFQLSGGVPHGFAASATRTMLVRTKVFRLTLNANAQQLLERYRYFYAYLKILQKTGTGEPAVLGKSFKLTAAKPERSSRLAGLG